MEAVDDQTLLQQLSQALVAATSNSDEERNPATQFILEIRRRDPIEFTFMLIFHLSDDSNETGSRALAAILIYNILHQRTYESQRKFNIDWVNNVDPEIREMLRFSATTGLFTDSPSFSIQCANLLGLFYSIEILKGNFIDPLAGMLDIVENSDSLPDRIACLYMFKCFQQSCYEYSPNCYANDNLKPITLSLFDVLIEGMNSQIPEIVHASIDTLMNPIAFYKRPIYFTKQFNDMIQIDFELIRSEDDDFALDGYSLTRKLIENYSEKIASYLQPLLEVVEEALTEGSDNRKIAACLLLQTIGEVESQANKDAEHPNSNLLNGATALNGYSSTILETLFTPLVIMICDCPIDDTETNVSLDKTPQNAAFSCFSYLAKAADSTALEPIFSFVEENGTNEDWRFRFCSIMLLNAATRLKSFDDPTSSNYIIAFDFFFQMISDPIFRIVEASFYSLGQIIQEKPELVLDPERFEMICSQIPTVLESSPNLESRCCWLLHIIFVAFKDCDEETAQLLGENFDQFADLLLIASESDDSTTVCFAYAAINDLILYAPNGIVDEYNRLFEKITARLLRILEETDDKLNTTLEMNRTIGICSILQIITMFVGDAITCIADQLMGMLFQLLQTSNGILISEVLPCIGAVARAIGNQFAPYAEEVIPLLDELLQSPECIQPASFLIGDLYSSLDSIPSEVTDSFVHSLFEAFNFDNLSKESRNSIINVLGTQIIQNIGTDCFPWLDTFLDRLELESKAAVEEQDLNGTEYAEMIHETILICFQTLVPILAETKDGFKRVKFFFYIFDHVAQVSRGNVNVLKQAVILIEQIAEVFGRKLNVVLNKRNVKLLLNTAKNSENEELSQMAEEVLEIVKHC